METSEQEIKRFEKAFSLTHDLIVAYKELKIKAPFSLRGNLGEFIVAIELLRQFKGHKISYKGGSSPIYDIEIDGKTIQVKTQFKHPLKRGREWEYDFEACPTIKKHIIDERKVDFIILVLLYLNEDYSKIVKRNIYVFNQDDFGMFDTRFCWSGKSKGDRTIMNVLRVSGNLPPKTKEVIDHYNTHEYKKLFENAKDGWNKIEAELKVEK
jgi:hypothetical protein